MTNLDKLWALVEKWRNPDYTYRGLDGNLYVLHHDADTLSAKEACADELEEVLRGTSQG